VWIVLHKAPKTFAEGGKPLSLKRLSNARLARRVGDSFGVRILSGDEKFMEKKLASKAEKGSALQLKQGKKLLGLWTPAGGRPGPKSLS